MIQSIKGLAASDTTCLCHQNKALLVVLSCSAIVLQAQTGTQMGQVMSCNAKAISQVCIPANVLHPSCHDAYEKRGQRKADAWPALKKTGKPQVHMWACS